MGQVLCGAHRARDECIRSEFTFSTWGSPSKMIQCASGTVLVSRIDSLVLCSCTHAPSSLITSHDPPPPHAHTDTHGHTHSFAPTHLLKSLSSLACRVLSLPTVTTSAQTRTAMSGSPRTGRWTAPWRRSRRHWPHETPTQHASMCRATRPPHPRRWME